MPNTQVQNVTPTILNGLLQDFAQTIQKDSMELLNIIGLQNAAGVIKFLSSPAGKIVYSLFLEELHIQNNKQYLANEEPDLTCVPLLLGLLYNNEDIMKLNQFIGKQIDDQLQTTKRLQSTKSIIINQPYDIIQNKTTEKTNELNKLATEIKNLHKETQDLKITQEIITEHLDLLDQFLKVDQNNSRNQIQSVQDNIKQLEIDIETQESPNEFAKSKLERLQNYVNFLNINQTLTQEQLLIKRLSTLKHESSLIDIKLHQVTMGRQQNIITALPLIIEKQGLETQIRCLQTIIQFNTNANRISSFHALRREIRQEQENNIKANQQNLQITAHRSELIQDQILLLLSSQMNFQKQPPISQFFRFFNQQPDNPQTTIRQSFDKILSLIELMPRNSYGQIKKLYDWLVINTNIKELDDVHYEIENNLQKLSQDQSNQDLVNSLVQQLYSIKPKLQPYQGNNYNKYNNIKIS